MMLEITPHNPRSFCEFPGVGDFVRRDGVRYRVANREFIYSSDGTVERVLLTLVNLQ